VRERFISGLAIVGVIAIIACVIFGAFLLFRSDDAKSGPPVKTRDEQQHELEVACLQGGGTWDLGSCHHR
jgi:hypothetical protein